MATNERDDASFNEFLVQQVAEKDAKIKLLEAQIEQLKREKGISSAREGLTFNDRTGLWAEESGRHYCTKCLDQEKRNPVKSELPWGWRCTACGEYYSNPDSPRPVVNTRGPRRGRI